MSDYITVEELKATAELTNTTFADSDLELAVTAASRGIEEALGQRFWADASDVTRYYTAELSDSLRIDPLVSLTTLQTAPGSDGVFSYTWTQDSDFVLEPRNAVLDGVPFNTIRILSNGRYTWPEYANSVKVVGKFGWAAVPAGIKQLTTMIATRLVRRTREAPFGVISFGLDGATVRASQFANDPEYKFLTAPYGRKRLLV